MPIRYASRLLYTLFVFCLPILSGSTHAESMDNLQELISLDADAVRHYSAVHFLGSAAAPIPLSLLPIINISDRFDDPGQIQKGANNARIVSGGAPVTAMDSLLRRQLFSSGRFVEAAGADLQVYVQLRAYQSEYRSLDLQFYPEFLQRLFARGATLLMSEGQQALAAFDVRVEDRRRGKLVQMFTVLAQMPVCQRLGRRLPLDGTPDNETPDAIINAYLVHYMQTAIGQISVASINAISERLHNQLSGTWRYGHIVGRNAEHLQLSLTENDVKPGDEYALYHKDVPDQLLGHIHIASASAHDAMAYAVDMHSGSVTIGDIVRVSQPNANAAVFLPVPEAGSCPGPIEKEVARKGGFRAWKAQHCDTGAP